MLTRARNYFNSFDRRLWVLCGAWLVNGLGFSMTLPFLSLYLHGERGVPMSWVGSIFLVAGLCRALGQLPGGQLADRLGCKKTIIGAQAARMLSYLALAACLALQGPLLLIGALISVNFFFGAIFQCGADVLTARLTAGEQRVEAYGLTRVGLNVGWMSGPAIGAFLAKTPYSLLFLLSAGAVAVSVAFLTFLVREVGLAGESRHPSEIGLREILSDRTFLAFCGAVLVIMLLMSQLVSTLSIYTTKVTGISKFQLGWLYTINGLLCITLQMPVAALLKRFRMTSSLAVGSLIYAAGYLTLAWRAGFWGAALSVMVITVGEVITNPPATALASLLSPGDRLGRNMGAFGLARGLGFSLGPWIGGVLFDAFSGRPLGLWGAVAGFGAAAALGFMALGRFGKIPSEKSPSSGEEMPRPER